MSAQSSGFIQTAHAHVFITAKEDRRTKREHQQLTHVINRMLCRMEVPDKAARAVAGLHGVFNGREVASFPAYISHKWAARQMNFRGQDENTDQFMCRALAAVREAQLRAGRKFFEIRRADGVTLIQTCYEADYIGEAALWALVEARASEMWKQHPAKAVTDELIDAAIAKLPECPPAPEGERSDGPSITDDAIIKGLWTRVDGLTETALTKIAAAGGDPVQELREIHTRQMKMAVEARRAQLERERREAEDERERDPEGMWACGKDISDNPGEFSTAAALAPEQTPPRQTDPPPGAQEADSQNFTEAENSETEKPMLAAALNLAARGFRVFPVYGVADGVCDCWQGSECENVGKHPIEKGWQRQATEDPAQIALLWTKHPHANIGVVMGGQLRLIAIDVDPRNGGDASLCDLVDAHGDAWLDTFTQRTGSLGNHFVFRIPEGVEIHDRGKHKGKLGPGVDVKAEGGFIVGAGSRHLSGRSYEVERDADVAEAPPWLVEALTRALGEAPSTVVNFQERRSRSSSGGPAIVEGERNERLFRVGCAVWGKGEADSAGDLLARLEAVNAERVSPPLSSSEVWKIVESITSRYTRGVPIENEGAA